VDILLVAGDEVNPLLADVFNLPVSEVPVMRKILVDPVEGLVADGVVRADALASVLRLRERYGSTPVGSTGGIVDSR
jgi:hypothetical protein